MFGSRRQTLIPIARCREETGVKGSGTGDNMAGRRGYVVMVRWEASGGNNPGNMIKQGSCGFEISQCRDSRISGQIN